MSQAEIAGSGRYVGYGQWSGSTWPTMRLDTCSSGLAPGTEDSEAEAHDLARRFAPDEATTEATVADVLTFPTVAPPAGRQPFVHYRSPPPRSHAGDVVVVGAVAAVLLLARSVGRSGRHSR